MPDKKSYTEKTEVSTETKRSGQPEFDDSTYKETTVKTERTIEKDEDEPVIVITNKK